MSVPCLAPRNSQSACDLWLRQQRETSIRGDYSKAFLPPLSTVCHRTHEVSGERQSKNM